MYISGIVCASSHAAERSLNDQEGSHPRLMLHARHRSRPPWDTLATVCVVTILDVSREVKEVISVAGGSRGELMTEGRHKSPKVLGQCRRRSMRQVGSGHPEATAN
jgi:hypothetical protein